MLSQRFTLEQLKEVLVPRSDWRPFPTVDDREPWDGLRDSIRQAHLSRGEKRLDFDYPPVPATRFLDYARDGNRSRYEGLTFGRRKALVDLILAECIEADGRFLDDIANGIWAICEESFWGVPAHIGAQRAGVGLPDVTEPIVDLFAAETSALLAWATYLLGDSLDAVSPLIRPRIALEVERRILEPLFTREDFGWMGFQGQSVNNWNPWIVSNWLTSALIVEPDEARRAAHVEKALRTVDHFIDPYPKDGGCDEGPSYWGRAGAALYDCLRILHSASGGAVDVYDEPLVQEIARFIYRVHIGGQYFVNFADAPATLVPSPGVVFAYGKAIGDEQMMRLGA
ncbi:MAG TPA: heparinase, partial [Armatimonadota bacterium]|nr:heparinase [Armatimonadota bacterium]